MEQLQYIQNATLHYILWGIPQSNSTDIVTISIVQRSDGYYWNFTTLAFQSVSTSGSMTFSQGEWWTSSFTPGYNNNYMITITDSTLGVTYDIPYISVGQPAPASIPVTTTESSYKLTDFETALDSRLKQPTPAILSSTELDSIISVQAIQIYSKHKPYIKTVDITANGTYTYTINTTNFPGWTEGLSEIAFIEYPAGESQNPRDNEIGFDEYDIYLSGTTKYLRFLDDTPSSGTIRVKFTRMHAIGATANNTTVYDVDFSAFCDLCTSIACRDIASKYSHFTDSTYGADAVEYRTKGDMWASRSKLFLDSYIKHMFQDISAAFVQKDIDTIYGELNISRLTHDSGTR